MKVLHVLDHSLPLQSGYTFRTRAILKAQQALGIEVRGITGVRHFEEGPDHEIVDGLNFHRTSGQASGPAGLREWREIGALAQSIEQLATEWQPDIIHAHSPALCGLAGVRAAKKLDIPMVYEIRAFWEDAAVGNGTGSEGSVKYNLTRALENRVVGNADAVFTICDGLREDLIDRGFDGGRIGIMRNGVDLSLFGDVPEPDEPLRKELGIGKGPIIGFIGSFYDYEGLDDLIAAMPELIAEHPEARLLMVGGGPMADALRQQAQSSEAADAIKFVGRVPHSEVERYYSLCDVMAYPRKAMRLTELVTPLKPLEAMAQRRLVAASDIGGHRELMRDGETGVLFAPDNPSACAQSLSRLITQKDQWDDFRTNGIAHIRANHDWAKNARRYQDVYQVLLARSDHSPISAAA